MLSSIIQKSKILIVDDDPNVLASTRRNLDNVYDIWTAQSAEKAIDILHNQGPFSVVISDYSMGEITGLDFLDSVSKHDPNIVSIMLTGHAQIDIVIKAVNEGKIHKFLTKPCSINNLCSAVSECLCKYELAINKRFTHSFTAQNGTVLKVEYSNACFPIIGYSSSALVADTDLYVSAISNEYREFVTGQYKLLCLGISVSPFEYEIICTDGNRKWLRETAMVPRSAGNQSVNCDCIVEDITTSKFAQDALKKSEEQFRAIANYTYDWESWIDSDSKLLWVNPAVERITGYTVEECMKMVDYPFPIIHQDDREIVSRFREVGQYATGKDLEFRFIRKDAQVRWGAVSWQPLITLDGFRRGHRSTIRDITESKLLRDCLEQSEQFNRTIIHNASEGIVFYDREFRYQLWNNFMQELTGMSEGQVLGNVAFDLFPHLRQQGIDKLLQSALKGQIVKSDDRPHMSKNGKLTWICGTYCPNYNAAKEITGVIAIITDVTERKLAQQALETANIQLIEQDRLKSEFISTVSHEMRTPLCIFKNIISNALAGVMGSISSKLHADLTTADLSIDRLSRIISKFLDSDVIDSGFIKLDFTSFDCAQFISEVIKSFETLLYEKNIKLTSNYNAIGEITADRDKLTQVLTNLIGNAIKFVPSEGGIIDIDISNNDKFMVINVTDNGKGIKEVDLQRIFKKFVQIAPLPGPGEHGTGLGLYITKKLVEMHGGTIRVASDPGISTVFTVSLPAT